MKDYQQRVHKRYIQNSPNLHWISEVHMFLQLVFRWCTGQQTLLDALTIPTIYQSNLSEDKAVIGESTFRNIEGVCNLGFINPDLYIISIRSFILKNGIFNGSFLLCRLPLLYKLSDATNVVKIPKITAICSQTDCGRNSSGMRHCETAFTTLSHSIEFWGRKKRKRGKPPIAFTLSGILLALSRSWT